MNKLSTALLAASVLASGALIVGSPSADAASCAMIRGTGVGLTDGIARFMATKAVTDSAAKYAPAGKYTLSPVKLNCSGLSCQGAAKACKK